MRRPLVAGNWKMNGARQMALSLAGEIARGQPTGVDVVVCPPAAYIDVVRQAGDGAFAIGAQDCSEYEPGAYTGEHAADMLADLGCTYVIVGHSERRQYFGDTDVRVAQKVSYASACGLTPILCVGESLEERQRNATIDVVSRQLDAVLSLPDATQLLSGLVVAYEPVWAIGTGESASPQQAGEVHTAIRERIAQLDRTAAAALRILYGGSVKPDNAAELFAETDIDGGLIGGASLSAQSFIAICQAAAEQVAQKRES